MQAGRSMISFWHTAVAQIAVMKKLIVVAHSLYKSGEMYDNTFCKKNYRNFIGIDTENILVKTDIIVMF